MPSKPMYFPPPPFNLGHAVECSGLVDIAYGMYYQWVKEGKTHTPADFHWQKPQQSTFVFNAPIWGNSEVLVFNDLEPFALVAHREKNAYVIFRGTESLEDWYTDFEIDQVPYELPNLSNVGKVHEGFFDLYKSLRQSVLEQLNTLQNIRTLYITGHSLGAALAMVATPDLMTNTSPQQYQGVFQYNLAGPRAVDPILAGYMNASQANNYRIVNSCDLVPEVPPSVCPTLSGDVLYEHVGFPVTYTAQYGSVAGNHDFRTSYHFALTHPEQPQGLISNS